MAESSAPDRGADNPGGADLRRAAPREPGKRAVTPRHAASLIVWRQASGEPEILMGVRHAKHKFMPSVLVFPGGRVDRSDHGVKVRSEMRAETEALLARAPAYRELVGYWSAEPGPDQVRSSPPGGRSPRPPDAYAHPSSS